MSKKIRYEDKPFGDAKLGKRVYLQGIPLLPRPEALAAKEKTRKITLGVSEQSLAFFKQQAKKLNMPYQQMIRRVLDEYSAV